MKRHFELVAIIMVLWIMVGIGFFINKCWDMILINWTYKGLGHKN